MTTEIHWTSPVEDFIAISTPREIANYYFTNSSHRKIFKKDEILKSLRAKFGDVYDVNSFEDFLNLVMISDMEEDSRLEYAITTRKNNYVRAHIDKWLKEHPNKRSKLLRIAEENGNLEVVNYLESK